MKPKIFPLHVGTLKVQIDSPLDHKRKNYKKIILYFSRPTDQPGQVMPSDLAPAGASGCVLCQAERQQYHDTRRRTP